MSMASFYKLVDMLDIQVDETKSRNSTGGVDPIDKTLIVACGLRFLGGEQHKSLTDIYHTSESSVRRSVNRFLDAVLQCKDLAIELPKEEELESLANGWAAKSTADGVLSGCLLALDGFLSSRIKPSVSNDADYYTKHKNIYALNVQAACDHHLRFRYVCVCGPGKLNDGRAHTRCRRLRRWLDRLPTRYFIAADNAYPLSSKVLIPFKGAQRNVMYNSSFNFYLSQLRIRVEMAFGRMTTKFRIMRQKNTCALDKHSRIIQVVTRLHNYVIDNDGLPDNQQRIPTIGDNNRPDAQEVGLMGIDALRDHEEGNMGFIQTVPYEDDDGSSRSSRRMAMVAQLEERTIVRPNTA